MKYIVVLNLTSDQLDSSFSLIAEMTGASVIYGWKNGAPVFVSDPENSLRTQKITIPAIASLLKVKLQGFELEQIMATEFVIVGGSEELKRWLAYMCGKWNMTCTFWFQKIPNIYSSETIRPGDNDAVFSILSSVNSN